MPEALQGEEKKAHCLVLGVLVKALTISCVHVNVMVDNLSLSLYLTLVEASQTSRWEPDLCPHTGSELPSHTGKAVIDNQMKIYKY